MIDPRVGHEVGILCREHRADDQVRDVVEGERLAVALRQLPEEHPIRGVHLGEAGEARKIQRHRFDVGEPLLPDVVDGSPRRVGSQEGEQSEPGRADDGDGAEHGQRQEATALAFEPLGFVDRDLHAVPRGGAFGVHPEDPSAGCPPR